MQEADKLQRFLFENSNIRGHFIHLSQSYLAVRERYDYPPIVAQQLGQALAASSLLGATIKLKGALILQIQSTGPINMLVAQCNHERQIRGLARWQAEPSTETLAKIYGNGRIVITIDNDLSDERYQGIVGLEGESLASALETYFARSEQLETRLWLAADDKQAVGLLLQKMPADTHDTDPDMWQRIEALGTTLTPSEMLKLGTQDILHRLFHNDDIRLFDPETVSFNCSCSQEKIETMLISLGLDEAQAIVAEKGKIEVNCDFCNQAYIFDAAEVKSLFNTH